VTNHSNRNYSPDRENIMVIVRYNLN